MRNHHRLPAFLLITLAPALLAFGCDDGDVAGSTEPPAIPRSDLEYIDQLAPHHQMAMEMADQVLARGSDPEVVAMAEAMKAAQTEELATLQSVREDLTGRRQFPSMVDPHGEDDLAELSGLSGIELDREFLRHMIPHHAGAVQTSHRALPNLAEDELIDLAEMTIEMQTREMNQMLDMLERLGE